LVRRDLNGLVTDLVGSAVTTLTKQRGSSNRLKGLQPTLKVLVLKDLFGYAFRPGGFQNQAVVGAHVLSNEFGNVSNLHTVSLAARQTSPPTRTPEGKRKKEEAK